MDPQQLENLKLEIIDAIVTQGATRKRAEELAASIPSKRDEVSAESAAAAVDLVDDESAMPYLDKNGNLVFQGNLREFAAYRADSGEKLWASGLASLLKQMPVGSYYPP